MMVSRVTSRRLSVLLAVGFGFAATGDATAAQRHRGDPAQSKVGRAEKVRWVKGAIDRLLDPIAVGPSHSMDGGSHDRSADLRRRFVAGRT